MPLNDHMRATKTVTCNSFNYLMGVNFLVINLPDLFESLRGLNDFWQHNIARNCFPWHKKQSIFIGIEAYVLVTATE